jgi:hypothetical protein
MSTTLTPGQPLMIIGGIGQPMSLLLKLNPLVTELSVYDVRGAVGVGADIGHVNTPAVTSAFTPENNGLEHALTGADIILIPAGVGRFFSSPFSSSLAPSSSDAQRLIMSLCAAARKPGM